MPTRAVIIGGGFYGVQIALFVRSWFDEVVIIEKGTDLLTRASFVNQARVHNGYHYPRNFTTALRSRENFARFVEDFQPAIDDSFTKLYAIAQDNSKVNARQFLKFCQDIGANVAEARPELTELFDPQFIESVFEVTEHAFNADTLRQLALEQLAAADIQVRYNSSVQIVSPGEADRVLVTLDDGEVLEADAVFNCTYAHINSVLAASDLPLLPMKYEITEMALVQMPEQLQQIGITVMDGPFFSTMPFPAKNAHTVSHVRYTPHRAWTDDGEYRGQPYHYLQEFHPDTNYASMLGDIARFVPSMREAQYQESLFEVKAVLQSNEADDGRPILFRADYGLPNFFVIMGGKIDNIYDIFEVLGKYKERYRK